MPHCGHGRHRRTEFVTYYEPVTTTTVTYAYDLDINTYALTEKKTRGPQVWKISLRCVGGTDDYRTLLYSMTQVMPQVLGTHTHGMGRFEVYIGRKGGVEVKRYQ